VSTFKKATRKQSKLRLAMIGPSGSGKTLSALLVAKSLGQRIAVIDSERGSASLYAGSAADFDVLELDDFAPQKYVAAIQAAEREGYDVIVVDSLSHAWFGKGGALDMKDAVTKRSASKNSFDAWRDVTPHHNALVDALVGCKCHIIVTMRSKTEYVLEENERGKKVPRKVGMAPIQREGLEYEFTLVGEMDLDHNFIVSKSRCFMPDGRNIFDNAVINKPGEQFADALLRWLTDGVAVAPDRVAAQQQERAAETATQPERNRSEPPPIDGGLTRDEQIKMLLDVDLPKCETVDHFAVFASELVRLHGGIRNSVPWTTFQAACAARDVSPRDAVNLAKKMAGAT
jgi:AAA domain